MPLPLGTGPQIVSIAGLQEVVPLPAVLCAVGEGHAALTDHFKLVAADDDGGRALESLGGAFKNNA